MLRSMLILCNIMISFINHDGVLFFEIRDCCFLGLSFLDFRKPAFMRFSIVYNTKASAGAEA